MKWLCFFWAIVTCLVAVFMIDDVEHELIMFGISIILYGIFYISCEIEDIKEKR